MECGVPGGEGANFQEAMANNGKCSRARADAVRPGQASTGLGKAAGGVGGAAWPVGSE